MCNRVNRDKGGKSQKNTNLTFMQLSVKYYIYIYISWNDFTPKKSFHENLLFIYIYRVGPKFFWEIGKKEIKRV